MTFEDGSRGDGVVGHSTGQLGGVEPWWPRYIGGEHKHLSCIWFYLLFVTTRSNPDQYTALRRNRRKSRAPVPAGNVLKRQAGTSISCQDLDDRSYPPNPPPSVNPIPTRQALTILVPSWPLGSPLATDALALTLALAASSRAHYPTRNSAVARYRNPIRTTNFLPCNLANVADHAHLV